MEAGEVEVTAHQLVAGDRPVVDGLMDVGGGEGVAFGGGDPGVEGGVVGPDGDDDCVPVAAGRFADQFGEDPVGLADGAPSLIQAR